MDRQTSSEVSQERFSTPPKRTSLKEIERRVHEEAKEFKRRKNTQQDPFVRK